MFVLQRGVLRRQPATFRLNWRNPITRGLIFCVPGTPWNYFDLVSGRRPTITGTLGATNTQFGKIGRFNGTEAIDYTAFTASELSTTTPATVSWIQQNTTQAGGDTICHFHPNGSVEAFYVYQDPGSGSDYFFATGQGGSSGIQFNGVGSISNDTPERFMLVASAGLVNTTGSNWALFRGTTKLANTGAVAAGPGAATTIRLGALASATAFYEGGIGQFCVWNRALTDQEALSYQANPLQIFESEPRIFSLSPPPASVIVDNIVWM